MVAWLALEIYSIDMNIRSLCFVSFLALCCSAFGDKANPPVVGNITHMPVRILLHWDNGPDQPGYLPPMTKCFQRLAGRHLVAISVKKPDGANITYGQQLLDRLRNHNASPFEVWIIGTTGLTLEGKEGLRQFK